MNRDDIIRMAKEAGAKKTYFRFSGNVSYTMVAEDIERFAALVAAAERERIKAERQQYPHGYVCFCPEECAAALRAAAKEPK